MSTGVQRCMVTSCIKNLSLQALDIASWCRLLQLLHFGLKQFLLSLNLTLNMTKINSVTKINAVILSGLCGIAELKRNAFLGDKLAVENDVDKASGCLGPTLLLTLN